MTNPLSDSDAERRFGGLSRLFGSNVGVALQQARVAVVGIGGVGSWAAEALARSGVGSLTLIDLDHVSESNINRQVHALSETLGQSKVLAMAARIQQINPACNLTLIDDFVSPDNVAQLLGPDLTVVLDCADQIAAKVAMVLQSRERKQALIVCGGAGGKTDPLALRSGDLSLATHDALLGRLRNTLRKDHGFARGGGAGGKSLKRLPKMGVSVLWVDQPTVMPPAWGGTDSNLDRTSPQGLSCAGYGSSVTVTATMGLVAANEAIKRILASQAVLTTH